jgi:hypothetical protein
MPDIRIHRYAVEPADTDEFFSRRAEVIRAIRTKHPGLTEARLIRLEDGSFIDSWRWESAEQMQAALAEAPTFVEVRAAMSLARDVSNQDGDVVDER